MGKKMQKTGGRAKQLVVEQAPCSRPPRLERQLISEGARPQPEPQLKEGEAVVGGEGEGGEGRMWELGVAKTMYFLNGQEYYSEIELDCYFICLANLIRINRQRIAITCSPELTNKIRKYLHRLTQEHHPSAPYAVKVKAIFHILVGLIYQNQHEQQRKPRSKSLLADRSILSSLLKIHLPHSTTLSKLYGLVMLAITSKSHNAAVREAIIRSILTNLRSIEHQSTLFNLLVYLRGEKNKAKISLSDLQEGQVFPFLMLGYEKYIGQYQSYYILDYLRHLLDLFPCMASSITAPFLGFLIHNLRLMNMHHPMHEATILAFMQQGFKHLEAGVKQAMIEEICKIQVEDVYMQAKIAKILIQHQTCSSLIKHITCQDYLMNFIRHIQIRAERNTVVSCVEVLIDAANKINQHNNSLSRYLVYLLRERVDRAGLADAEMDCLIARAQSGQL